MLQKPTRPIDGATNTEAFRGYLRYANELEDRANRIQKNVRMRHARRLDRDDATLDDLVAKDPILKAAIADQQFAQRESVSYGLAAILDALETLNQKLP